MPAKTTHAAGAEQQQPIQNSADAPSNHYYPQSQQCNNASQEKHRIYIDSLKTPSLADVERIAKVQESKEQDGEKRRCDEAKRANGSQVDLNKEESEQREQAAGAIQRVYRGHRTRRELEGLRLSPTTRWVEAIKDAQYKQLTTPHARNETETSNAQSGRPGSSGANKRWHQISRIARHAHGEPPETQSSSSDEAHGTVDSPWHAYHKQQERKEKQAGRGKMMDLPYFLEMVDLKHRYGSNLRAYHAEWKKADTHENYFYWLDHGEGRNVELSSCSRERLEREQVRYLSREERLQYLVDVDDQGRLRWRKNGELIDTSEEYRDSVEGIVHQSDSAKTWRQDELEELKKRHEHKGVTERRNRDASNSDSSGMSEEEMRYPDPGNIGDAKSPRKIIQVTPAVILNRLMRMSIKKNTWIFVADTSMNLYVGIKQSGAFQHSSFIQGTRISSAGLIKIKNGQLRSLSPLSGHYRPPTSAFKLFVNHLKDEHVDMSRVSISKSYAVLVGLETYMSGKQRVKKAEKKLVHGVEHVLSPTKAHERKEKEKDSSESAKLEQQKLREQQEQEGLGKALKKAREKIKVDEHFAARDSRLDEGTHEHGNGLSTVSNGLEKGEKEHGDGNATSADRQTPT